MAKKNQKNDSVTENTVAIENNTTGRVVRILLLAGIIILFLAIFVISATHKTPASEQAWDMRTTIGNSEAKNHYVMYTDLMCPYCDVFSRAVMEHQEEFEQFLADNDVLFEIRLTDMLYYGSGSEMSIDAAEAAYCAIRDDRFWDYYHAALTALYDDYHSKGIGSSKTATSIKNMPEDYWLKIGQEIGLGESFENCVKGHETADIVEETTMKAAKYAEGMPTFDFGKFKTSGFSDTWGWDEAKGFLEAGL